MVSTVSGVSSLSRFRVTVSFRIKVRFSFNHREEIGLPDVK